MQVEITRVKPLILASASPRRRRLIAAAAVPFIVVVPRVDETQSECPAREAVTRNAAAKHDWCRSRFGRYPILAADTLVCFCGKPVPKPSTLGEARIFLGMFSGREQTVYTAAALSAPGQMPEILVVESTVYFKEIEQGTIDNYLARVNPMDKAGGYDIDQFGSSIITRYEGSYTNIMGLPMELVGRWLGLDLAPDRGGML